MELITGYPLFPAHDENELYEYFILRIDEPPKHMIYKGTKKKVFYNRNMELIRSRHPKHNESLKFSKPGQESISFLLKDLGEYDDDEFFDFINVSKYSP